MLPSGWCMCWWGPSVCARFPSCFSSGRWLPAVIEGLRCIDPTRPDGLVPAACCLLAHATVVWGGSHQAPSTSPAPLLRPIGQPVRCCVACTPPPLTRLRCILAVPPQYHGSGLSPSTLTCGPHVTLSQSVSSRRQSVSFSRRREAQPRPGSRAAGPAQPTAGCPIREHVPDLCPRPFRLPPALGSAFFGQQQPSSGEARHSGAQAYHDLPPGAPSARPRHPARPHPPAYGPGGGIAAAGRGCAVPAAGACCRRQRHQPLLHRCHRPLHRPLPATPHRLHRGRRVPPCGGSYAGAAQPRAPTPLATRCTASPPCWQRRSP